MSFQFQSRNIKNREENQLEYLKLKLDKVKEEFVGKILFMHFWVGGWKKVKYLDCILIECPTWRRKYAILVKFEFLTDSHTIRNNYIEFNKLGYKEEYKEYTGDFSESFDEWHVGGGMRLIY